MKVDILIIDDEKAILDSLNRRIKRSPIKNKLNIKFCNSGKEAISVFENSNYSAVITDIRMPEIDGFEVIKKVLNINPETIVVVMTAFADVKEAVLLFKAGIYDYITKPFEFEEFEAILSRVINVIESKEKINKLQNKLNIANGILKNGFIGNSKKIVEVKEMIDSLSESEFPVLITGESGSGKEVAADYVVECSRMKNGPYIKINCSTIVSTLLESELFGHEAGAFTGAVEQKKGKFELAHNGTLFLDEIGEMELQLQAKILRVLQNGTFERVGGTKTLTANIRIIAATNRDLETMVNNGEFREDLYYRLNIIRLNVPSLRDRKEDIPELCQFILSKYNNRYNKDISSIDKNVLNKLQEYSFPGNIRELENIIARGFVKCKGKTISADNLDFDFEKPMLKNESIENDKNISENDFWNLNKRVEFLEEKIIKAALSKTRWNKSETASLLGISRRQLYYKMEKLNLNRSHYHD